ncbi:MAG: 30S ribosomal protein S17 [Planctomycetota bacterium]
MPKAVALGVVTSDRTAKTRRVEIPRLIKHPKYGKYLRRRTVCYVHDEENQSEQGDTVEIVECRPRSKTKRWELVRVVSKSRLVDVAAMRAAAKAEKQQGEQTENA